MAKERIVLDKEAQAYFKNGLQKSNAVEVLAVAHFIEDRKANFEKKSYDFMRKEIGRRCGAIFSKVCRGFKQCDFEAVQNELTGGRENENSSNY